MLNVVYIVYDPLLTRTTTISEKNSFMTPFLLCSYSRAHQTTVLLKILGDGCMGCPPPQIFLGDRPSSVSPRSPPLHVDLQEICSKVVTFEENRIICPEIAVNGQFLPRKSKFPLNCLKNRN